MISKTEHLKLRAVDVLNNRIERRIVPVGDRLPDVTVQTFDGRELPISSYHSKKPLLLGFMRASWCPYCRAQVTMLEGMADAFKNIGCEIVVISRETPEESTFTTEKFTLVTDLTNDFGRQLGMTYFATEEITTIYSELGIDEPVEGYWDTSELNVPATFIVDTEGRILFKHAKRDYTQRATGSEIIRELTCLNQRSISFE
ncbi:MAG: peroxiredoxin-like family protein [Verrucomicrobiota bacterium]